MLETILTAILGLDAQGFITYSNASAQSLLGHSPKALIGQRIALYVSDVQACLLKANAQDALKRSAQSMLATLTLESGRQTRVWCTLSYHEKSAPHEATYLLEMTDIERALNAERAAIENTQYKANLELFRNLAHEIKNPLGGITGAAQLINVKSLTEDDRECIALILKETKRLEQLVDRFLLPHRTPKKSEVINLHEILSYVESLLHLEFSEQIHIIRDYDISIPEFASDRGRLVQIFLNLARNAIQAMLGHQTAQPCLAFKTRLVRDQLVQGARHRHVIKISITDNGPGIDENIREKLFYPLVTGRADGVGLGLSIVKTFTEELQGQIVVRSRPGQTNFTLLLPFTLSNTVREGVPS